MLNFEEYKSKVLGCWMGKNIGGTYGGPMEGTKERFTGIEFYVQELNGEPFPNDDLDLQLVWLNAAERYGRHLTSALLGEYWLSYISPGWDEYGACMANMKQGMVPPLSGVLNNPHMNSNGAFIRSEIWACLAPGNPSIAVRYAKMDAEVDHAYEGIYSEIFCAAIQSAAFVESDKYKLIDIGLSYIPEDCAVTKAVKCVIDSFESHIKWEDAFIKLANTVPGAFSAGRYKHGEKPDIPLADLGYSVPQNIGIFILAWLYGEDDFGKSLSIAINCGEDTDCTAATLGAILGIIHGIDWIPEKWIEPISNKIKTICIVNHDLSVAIPQTTDELTDRILKAAPSILGTENCDFISGPGYSITTQDDLYCKQYTGNYWVTHDMQPGLEINPYEVKYSFEMLSVVLDYKELPVFEQNETKKFCIKFQSTKGYQQYVNVKIICPENVSAVGGNQLSCYMYQHFHAMSEAEFEIMIGEIEDSKIEILLEITIDGRLIKYYIPIVLIKNNGHRITGYKD